jgi:hypothetical protein
MEVGGKDRADQRLVDRAAVVCDLLDLERAGSERVDVLIQRLSSIISAATALTASRILGAASVGTTSRPNPTYTTLRDVTRAPRPRALGKAI